MKKGHLIVCGALLLGLAACQKDVMERVTNKATGSTHSPQQVQQKFYDVTGEEVTRMVQEFKNGRTNAALRAPDDSIPVDSSIYVIEAALNAELAGLNDRNYEFTNHSISIDAPASEQTRNIRGNDVDDAYTSIADAIIASIDPAMQRIKMIDITAAFVTSTAVTFTAEYSVMNTPSAPNCNLPLGVMNYLSAQQAMNSISPSLVNSCAAPTTVDALTTVQNTVNCPLVYGGCTTSQGGDGYIHFYNVGSHYITSGGNVASNNNPNELFATQLYNNCNWCNTIPGVLTLSAAQVNAYITNINSYNSTYISNNFPANFAPIQVAMGWQIMNGTNTQSCGQHKSFGWNMKLTYGIPYCGANPN